MAKKEKVVTGPAARVDRLILKLHKLAERDEGENREIVHLGILSLCDGLDLSMTDPKEIDKLTKAHNKELDKLKEEVEKEQEKVTKAFGREREEWEKAKKFADEAEAKAKEDRKAWAVKEKEYNAEIKALNKKVKDLEKQVG